LNLDSLFEDIDQFELLAEEVDEQTKDSIEARKTDKKAEAEAKAVKQEIDKAKALGKETYHVLLVTNNPEQVARYLDNPAVFRSNLPETYRELPPAQQQLTIQSPPQAPNMLVSLASQIMFSVVFGSVVKLITDFFGSLTQKVRDANSEAAGTSTGSKFLKWACVGAVIAVIVLIVYKRLRKKVDVAKRAEYAQAKKIPASEAKNITLNMLKSYNESNYEYYSLIEVLDEGVGDWVKNVSPTPTNLEKLCKKGIKGTQAFSNTTAEALEYKVIGSTAGKACNNLTAIANKGLITALGSAQQLKKFTSSSPSKKKEE
jgi:hypothetical protein